MDLIAEWTNAQDRVIDLVTAAAPDRIEGAVPACPDWSARNLLSHGRLGVTGGQHTDASRFVRDRFAVLGSLPDDDLSVTFA